MLCCSVDLTVGALWVCYVVLPRFTASCTLIVEFLNHKTNNMSTIYNDRSTKVTR